MIKLIRFHRCNYSYESIITFYQLFNKKIIIRESLLQSKVQRKNDLGSERFSLKRRRDSMIFFNDF